MTERDLERAVRDLAELFGWAFFHPWISIHSAHGWPDVTLCRPPRLILAELKSERGKLSLAQAEWQDLLGRCPGVEVAVWRPADLVDGTIERALR